MNTLNERRIETNISLSQTQKYVLAKLMAAETGLMAYEAVSVGRNVVAARDQLTGQKLMQFTTSDQGNIDPATGKPMGNSASITDTGINLMKEEGLADDMGELTEQGQQYAYAESPEDLATLAAENPGFDVPDNSQDTSNSGGPLGDPQGAGGMGAIDVSGMGTAAPATEGWKMIYDMNNALIEVEYVKNNKKL